MEILLIKNAPTKMDQVLVDGKQICISSIRDRQIKRELNALIDVLDAAKDENNMLHNGNILYFQPKGNRMRGHAGQGANKLEVWVSNAGFKNFQIVRGAEEAILRLPPGLSLGVVEYGEYKEQEVGGIIGIKDHFRKTTREIEEKIVPSVNNDRLSMRTMAEQILSDTKRRLFILSGKIGSGKTYAVDYIVQQFRYRNDCLLIQVSAELALGKEIDEMLMKGVSDYYHGNVNLIQFEKALYEDGELKNIVIFFDQMQSLIQDERNELVEKVSKWIESRNGAKAVFVTRENVNTKEVLMRALVKLRNGGADVGMFSINDLDESIFIDAGISRDELNNIKILTPLMYSVMVDLDNKGKRPPKIDTTFDVLDYYYRKIEESSERRNIKKLVSEVAPRIAYYLREFSNDEGFKESEINKQIVKIEGARAERINAVALEELCDAGVLAINRKNNKYSFFYEPFRDYLAARYVMNFLSYTEEKEERYKELGVELRDIIDATSYDKGSGKELALQYATFLFLEAVKDRTFSWSDKEKELLLELGANVGYEDTTVWNSLQSLLNWLANKQQEEGSIDYKNAVTINGALYEKISSDRITQESFREKRQILDSIRSLYFGIFSFLVKCDAYMDEDIETLVKDAVASSPYRSKNDFNGKLYGNIGALFQEYGKLYLFNAEKSDIAKDNNQLYRNCMETLQLAEKYHNISFEIKKAYDCSGQIRLISVASDKYYMARVKAIYGKEEEAKALYEEASSSYNKALTINEGKKSTEIQQAEERWVILWRWAGCYRELYKLTAIKDQRNQYMVKMISKQRESVGALLEAVADNKFAQYRNRKYIKQYTDDIIGGRRMNNYYDDKSGGDLDSYVKGGMQYEELVYAEDLINLYNSCGFYATIEPDILKKLCCIQG